jgi:hypothetical protein
MNASSSYGLVATKVTKTIFATKPAKVVTKVTKIRTSQFAIHMASFDEPPKAASG